MIQLLSWSPTLVDCVPSTTTTTTTINSSLILIPLHSTVASFESSPSSSPPAVNVVAAAAEPRQLNYSLVDDNPVASAYVDVDNKDQLKVYKDLTAKKDDDVDDDPIKKHLAVPEVSVTVYHHQAIFDPPKDFRRGKPWTYLGHGYGLHYTFDKDGKADKEKGYRYVKALGRELCREDVNCEPKEKADKKLLGNAFSLVDNASKINLPKWFDQSKSTAATSTNSHRRKPKLVSDHNSIELFNTGWDHRPPVVTNVYNHWKRPARKFHIDPYEDPEFDGHNDQYHNQLSSLNNVFF